MMRALILFLICLPTFLWGQNHESKREKIQNLKIAFITAEINLNSDESSKFWPIYNEAEDKIHDLRKQRYSAYIKYIKGKTENEISEIDAKKFIDIMTDCDQQELVIKEKLLNDLGKAVSYRKIVKLKKAEEDFKQKLLDQYRKQK